MSIRRMPLDHRPNAASSTSTRTRTRTRTRARDGVSRGRSFALWAALAVGGALSTNTGCVIAHSRQAMSPDLGETPPANARFVQEEDSGLLIGGFIQVSDADHFAVLLARLRERNRCKRLSSAQLDYYTDHWVVVAFPVARVTALCEPLDAPAPPSASAPAPAPASTSTPSPTVSEAERGRVAP